MGCLKWPLPIWYWWLVGGLEHEFYVSLCFHSVGYVITPTDELHHFSEGIKPTIYLYLSRSATRLIKKNVLVIGWLIYKVYKPAISSVLWRITAFQLYQLPLLDRRWWYFDLSAWNPRRIGWWDNFNRKALYLMVKAVKTVKTMGFL